MLSRIRLSHFKDKSTRLFHQNPIVETVKSNVILLLFETVSFHIRFHREISTIHRKDIDFTIAGQNSTQQVGIKKETSKLVHANMHLKCFTLLSIPKS